MSNDRLWMALLLLVTKIEVVTHGIYEVEPTDETLWETHRRILDVFEDYSLAIATMQGRVGQAFSQRIDDGDTPSL